MAITRAQLDAALEAVVTAIDARDFATARIQMAKAHQYFAALPESASDGTASVKYRDAIESAERAISSAEQAVAQSNGHGCFADFYVEDLG